MDPQVLQQILKAVKESSSQTKAMTKPHGYKNICSSETISVSENVELIRDIKNLDINKTN